MKKQNYPEWFINTPKPKKTTHRTNTHKKESIKKGDGRKNVAVEKDISSDAEVEFDPDSLKKITGSENPEQELCEMIGLNKIKKDIEKLKFKLEYNEERKSRGIDVESSTMHMIFMGNPGTGKTTIARILTGILYKLKYIRINQCVEVSGLDLVGGFVGQTAIKTKKIIDEARGGILFIDEAYALSSDSSNGKEAVSVLLKEMEDNRQDLIVIFAGYEQDMDKFININPGFRSRINKYFDFEDYSLDELLNIFTFQLRKKHLKIERNALITVAETLKRAKEYNNFSNGRFVRNLVEQIEEEHIINTVNIQDFNVLDTLTEKDVTPEIMQLLLEGI
jgi:SpoVK/Ycf46/Vps4 family AAA+-type ATPase